MQKSPKRYWVSHFRAELFSYSLGMVNPISGEKLQILIRVPSGDREAFAILFEQYENLVSKTAYLMLGEPTEVENALVEDLIHLKLSPLHKH